MKYITLFSFCFFLQVNTYAQSITETTNYINTLLKSSTFNPEFPGVEVEYKNSYDSIYIDEKGKIECVIFSVETKTGRTIKTPRFFSYIKSLEVNYKKDFSFYYVLNIKCSKSPNCFGGLNVDRDNISFFIKTKSDRDKLYNAFEHLLKISKEEKNYLEKDPFDNK